MCVTVILRTTHNGPAARSRGLGGWKTGLGVGDAGGGLLVGRQRSDGPGEARRGRRAWKARQTTCGQSGNFGATFARGRSASDYGRRLPCPSGPLGGSMNWREVEGERHGWRSPSHARPSGGENPARVLKLHRTHCCAGWSVLRWWSQNEPRSKANARTCRDREH